MMPHSFKWSVLVLIVFTAGLFALSGCKDVPTPQAQSRPSFAQMGAMHFSVATIDIVEEYTPPLKSPNVEHLFPTPPAEGVKIWVNDRLKADGGEYRMEVVIKDASVVEEQLPKTQGLKGTFTVDQSQRYNAKLNVEVKVYGTRKLLPEANAEVTVTKSRTIAENASLEERERLFNQMTNELLTMLNTELEKNIRNYFGAYLKY